MLTIEEIARQPLAQRLARMERTADDLAAAIRGQSETALSQRPAPDAWSAKEVVCHLRDAAEHLSGWMQQVLVMDDPALLATGTASRWAVDRQYHRHDVGAAWDAFRRRRDETLALIRGLAPEQMERGGRSERFGRLTIDGLVSLIAWHDDNHIDQLRRALEGKA